MLHAVLLDTLRLNLEENTKITNRHFIALVLIANGCCTGREIAAAAGRLAVAPKHYNDICNILVDLRTAGLIWKRDDILIPYRGSAHAVVYCTMEGYSFINKIEIQCTKLANKKLVK